MPLIAVPEQIGRKLAERGLDPNEYALDTDQRALVLKQADSLGTLGGIGEVGKSLLRGGVGGLARGAQFAGGLLRAAGDALPDAGLLEQRGREMEAIAGGARGATDATFKPGAAVANLPEWAQMGLIDVPETLGQVGGSVGASLLAGPFAPAAAMALGGAAEAQDAREAELARQTRLGRPTDEGLAMFKGGLYGIPAAAIELFGGGRIAKKLLGEGAKQVAKRGLLRRLVGNTAVGSGEEAAQQTLQDLIVESQVNPESVKRAALIGGIVQGPLATAAESRAAKKLPPKLDQPKDAADAMLAGIEGIESTEEVKVPDNEVAAFMATQNNNKTEWGVVGGPQKYDSALKKALTNGIKLTEPEVREIMAADEPDQVLRRISADWQLSEANRPETLKESLDRRLEREKQMAELEKRRDSYMSRIEQIEERMRKVELSQSERWRMNEKLKLLRAEVSKVDSSIAVLETADIEPTMAVGRPESPGFYSGEAAGTATPRNRPLQPAVSPAGEPMQQKTLREKAGTIMQEQIAAQRGNVPPANAGIAAAERALTDYRASTEGEKSIPFGEAVPGSLSVTPVPESAQQIAVQLQLTADPNSAKAATLVTPGAAVPAVPDGLASIETPHGVVVYNPQKVTAERVQQAAAGEVFDGTILGMSGNAPSSSDIAVTTSTADTPDVVGELVPNDPTAIQQAAAAQQAAVPGGTQQVKSAAEMLDDRQNDDTKIYGFGLGGLPDTIRGRFGKNFLGGSAVNFLNSDKPFGITPAKDGSIPTAGLLERMAMFVPKAEMESYEADEFRYQLKLAGNSISKDDLQQLLTLYGPQLEVMELGAVDTSEAEKRLAAAEHVLETIGLETSVTPTFFYEKDSGANLDYNSKTDKVVKATMGAGGVPISVPVEPQVADAIREYYKAYQANKFPKNDATIGKYGVEPREVKDLTAPVELLVKLPVEQRGELDMEGEYTGKTEPYKRFTGGHHGVSGHNALAFVRGNTEVLPDGRKVFHAFEVQSDWAHQRAELEEYVKKLLPKIEASAKRVEHPSPVLLLHRPGRFMETWSVQDTRMGPEFHGVDKQDAIEQWKKAVLERSATHPALKDYNRLALKAAIKYAVNNGLDAIAISDAETAMMTEGHTRLASAIKPLSVAEVGRLLSVRMNADVIAKDYGADWKDGQYVSLGAGSNILRIDKPEHNNTQRHREVATAIKESGYGSKPGYYIPQEAGMRFNYDQQLPKIAAELTGAEPEKVTFAGKHKSPDNKVFKKDTITANLFDLTKVKQAEAEGATFTALGKDRMYLFGPGDLFGRLAKGGLLEKATRVALSPLRLINAATRDELTALAKRSPTYAYFMYKWPALQRERMQLFNRATKGILGLEAALKNPKIINLLHENATAGKVSYAGLSKAEVAQLHAVYKLIKAFHQIQRAFGVHVKDMDAAGNIFYRPPRDNDAYAIFSIDGKVWDAMKMGGREWEGYKKDWMDNWKKHRGGSPNWKQEALAALEDFQKPLAEMQARGGEPMFNAVRLRAGIPLPKSWRSNDLVTSMLNYADRWSMDLSWAKVVQNNPILRTAFGIKRDSKGVEVENPETFKGFGSAVAEANREGKLRVDADWTATEDTPIDVLSDGPAIDAIVHSFARRPMTRQNTKSYQLLEAFNHLAANTIMGPKSALRDFASAATIVNDYIGLKDTKQLLGSIGRYVKNPNDARLAAEQAGSQSMDTFTHEFGQDPGLAKRAHGIMYRAAYYMRQAQGRGIADTYGKALDYQLAHDTILERLQNGQSHPLVEEFGPADWRKMNPEEVAADVASRVVERVNPRYDVGSLPTWMIPQNRGFRSLSLALMRWSVGRYNKWYQDAVIPLYNGKPQRFFKSLFNGVVGAAAVQALIAYLEDKKPEEMTWAEFLHLPKDKRTADKVFNIIFGYLQAQGTMGILGDVGYQATKAATGRPIKAPDINPVYPAAILATDFANVIGQFLLNNPDGIQPQEWGELALELGRLSQSYRFVADRFDSERKSNRERRQFQQIHGLSPITAEPVAEPSGLISSFQRQPWTLSKSLQKAESPEDFRRLAKTLAERRMRGLQPPSVERELLHPIFYMDLARRRGREAMQEQLRADLEREQAAKRRRAFSAMFR